MNNKIYLFQSTDILRDGAIQNAIIIAPNKKIALKRFRQILSNNIYCEQHYRPEWFECQRIDLDKPRDFVQYGGDTWQFEEKYYWKRDYE